MSAISPSGELAAADLDDRALAVVASRVCGHSSSRGRIVRHALLAADIGGLVAAFVVATLLFFDTEADTVSPAWEFFLFFLTLPLWVLLVKLHGLYERDEERTDHSTADEVFGVVQVVTFGTWIVFLLAWATHLAQPQLERLVSFWTLAIIFVASARVLARALCRRRPSYIQNVLIVGGGDVGQLLARKIQQHPEYGINLVGFVDDAPKSARADLGDLRLLGTTGQLQEIVSGMDVERVIVAFSNEPDAKTMATVRMLRDREVIIDVVPRLFELVGPSAGMHTIEGMPLICLRPTRLSRTSLLCKRALDIVGSLLLLVVTAPLFAYAALRVKLDSPGPIFFKQTRLGMNMKPFTAVKFRTMRVDADEEVHRQYIQSVMSADAALQNGKYKLERADVVTRFGRWLRETSLDELPQLLNILMGQMSLVGPRPCIPYETENFLPHQFERFLVPQGLTGLWQVTARANSTFGEALEMDVAYVRGWSLGLDLRLILRTPFALLRQRRTTA
jgi:exopolysaccharide biosynthesis polyprenyl glycosylphosphotransferase